MGFMEKFRLLRHNVYINKNNTMTRAMLVVVALIIGGVLPIQAALNGKLMKTFGHPVLGAALSFLIGTLILVLYAFSLRLSFNSSLIRTTGWMDWMGGVLGAIYVTGIIMLIPRLGAGLAFCLAVSGQLLMCVLMDHFGLLGVPVSPISLPKLLGIAMMIAAVFLIRGKA
jgi:transporter family-2 protein